MFLFRLQAPMKQPTLSQPPEQHNATQTAAPCRALSLPIIIAAMPPQLTLHTRYAVYTVQLSCGNCHSHGITFPACRQALNAKYGVLKPPTSADMAAVAQSGADCKLS